MSDLSKQPKWVRDKFRKMELHLEDLERELKHVKGQFVEDTRLVSVDILSDAEYPLPDSGHIRFKLGKRKNIECRIHEESGQPYVQVMGDFTLSMRSVSSNVVLIKVEND